MLALACGAAPALAQSQPQPPSQPPSQPRSQPPPQGGEGDASALAREVFRPRAGELLGLPRDCGAGVDGGARVLRVGEDLVHVVVTGAPRHGALGRLPASSYVATFRDQCGQLRAGMRDRSRRAAVELDLREDRVDAAGDTRLDPDAPDARAPRYSARALGAAAASTALLGALLLAPPASRESARRRWLVAPFMMGGGVGIAVGRRH